MARVTEMMRHGAPACANRQVELALAGIVRFGWLAGWAALCGCGSGRVSVYPVQGQVLVNGQPADGASVVFHRQDADGESAGLVPRGTADAQGTFHLTTYLRDDGAPEGSYQVTIAWQAPLPSKDAEALHPDELAAQPNQLDPRYADPQRTPLAVTVSRGDNKLPPFAVD